MHVRCALAHGPPQVSRRGMVHERFLSCRGTQHTDRMLGGKGWG